KTHRKVLVFLARGHGQLGLQIPEYLRSEPRSKRILDQETYHRHQIYLVALVLIRRNALDDVHRRNLHLDRLSVPGGLYTKPSKLISAIRLNYWYLLHSSSKTHLPIFADRDRLFSKLVIQVDKPTEQWCKNFILDICAYVGGAEYVNLLLIC